MNSVEDETVKTVCSPCERTQMSASSRSFGKSEWLDFSRSAAPPGDGPPAARPDGSDHKRGLVSEVSLQEVEQH